MTTNNASSNAFVRRELLTAKPAPRSQIGVFGWMKRNLFASISDSILTLVALALLALIVPHLAHWLLIDATWHGTDRAACATIGQGGSLPDGWSAACWAYVGDKIPFFTFGSYPVSERWRPLLVIALHVAFVAPLMMPRLPYKGWNAIILFVVLPILSFVLLLGGNYGLTIPVPYLGPINIFSVSSGLAYVETANWGGLLVTLVISWIGIVVSLPFGILLALGRRSQLPVIKALCVAFIELVRGVPLITVLFMASFMLPLFLPPGMVIDKLLRALIGVAIFSSAYMAEVIRGGLQAIPKGQFEGADSLGLTYWQKMTLIIMPQAIKLVIPGIVNTFIGMFKDTSLVSIISMYDLFGIIRASFADPLWVSAVTPLTGLVFAAFVFWIFCFGMSRYSVFIERRLDTGHKR